MERSAAGRPTRDPLRRLPARTRWFLAATLAVLLVAVTSTVLIGAWADRVLLDEDRFSARIAGTLTQDEMNAYLTREVTDQVIARAPELIGVRPAIEAVLSEALRTRTAVVGARAALRGAHRAVRVGLAEESIAIDLEAVFTLAAALMQRGAPDIAGRFEAGLDTTRIDASAVGLRTGLFDWMDRLATVRWPLAGVGLLLLVGVIATAPSRRSGLLIAATAVATAGLLGLIGQRLAELWFVEQLPEREDARIAVTLAWRSMLREYEGWNAAILATGIAGIVGAVASGRLPDREVAHDFLGRSTWARIVAGAALGAAGLAVARWPLDAVRVIVVAAGVVAAGAGAVILLRNSLAGLRGVRPGDYWSRLRGSRLAAGFALATIAILVAGIGIWFSRTFSAEPTPVEPAPITVCNGHELLCDRRLTEVTFPGTHNSMAAASERGWYFPSQRYGIAQQLRDGVRALLIDTYYGIPSPQGVLTVIDPEVRRPELVAEHGEEVVSAAERIAVRLSSEGEPEVFLCHSFCELGATPVAAALVDLRDYLDANPGEFVIVIVQDQTSSEDTVRAFEVADLAERAYAHPVGEPWPTLGELLEEGKQLLVLAEHETPAGGDAPWYQPAFAFIEETSIATPTLESLTCAPGRGEPGNPLFLLNHWLTGRPALPSRALEVNVADVLLERARRCGDERAHVPNIVAVDFYDVGDVFSVARALNGLPLDDEDPAVGADGEAGRR
ncbi:MAG: hypothetical protein AB7F65_00465 [Dehalococcoidia bacterium]